MILNEGNYKRLVMQHARSHRIIRSATIALLDACNFRCKHCYVRDTYNRYIDTTTVKKFLFELKEGGCIWLLLTGGEPLLHPNFLKVYLYAYSLNSITTPPYLKCAHVLSAINSGSTVAV